MTIRGVDTIVKVPLPQRISGVSLQAVLLGTTMVITTPEEEVLGVIDIANMDERSRNALAEAGLQLGVMSARCAGDVKAGGRMKSLIKRMMDDFTLQVNPARLDESVRESGVEAMEVESSTSRTPRQTPLFQRLAQLKQRRPRYAQYSPGRTLSASVVNDIIGKLQEEPDIAVQYMLEAQGGEEDEEVESESKVVEEDANDEEMEGVQEAEVEEEEHEEEEEVLIRSWEEEDDDSASYSG
ncbi:hypothetical protein C8J57DRAFT_1316877 [Mycena rebaudengoi]|nr:hypothetical protein C8J57DRAFT_1316877 [Mycena rebaudengoi]